MSMSNAYQQSLADFGYETRPPMLERGSYIPWASHFRRYLNRKRENKKWLTKAIDEGPYEFRIFTLFETEAPRMQKEEDLRGDDLKHYEAEIEAMNLILISIPNDIYNSIDACTTTKSMWQIVERLMRGTVQNKVDRETRFNNEFDQFVAEPGEALVSVYNHFAQLMNDLERNGIIFPKVTINTKFLNCLQPEWLKHVTQVRLAKRLTEHSYDDFFDYLQQFEKLVNASKAKKLEKSHDPLALVAHTGSSSRTTTPYYVTHPSSVVDYDDDYQGDVVQNNYEDPLTFAMILLARAIAQCFFNPTNNRLRTSSNTRNQAIRTLRTTSSGTAANVQCYNCSEKDEAGVILTDEQNDFLFADASLMEEFEELSAIICLMAKIQPANFDSDEGPSYVSAFLSEVQTPSTSYVNPLFAKDAQEQKYPKQPKIIKNTISDDQIDSNIIFDEPNGDVNSGGVEYDNNVQESYLESYKENVRVFEMNKGNNTTYFDEYIEADRKAKRFEQESQSQFIHDRDVIRDLEQQCDKLELSVVELKRQTIELQKTQSILKHKMSENQDKYHDIVLDLEARAKKNEDVVLKIGLRAISSVRRPSNRDSSFKNSVLSNTKNSSVKVEVFDRSNKKPDVASKHVDSNKKIVTNDDIKNDLIAKNLLCDDMLIGDRESNLYTISISDMAASSPVCLMSKAISKKSWLLLRRLSHLNFDTINDLSKHDLVNGLSKFKYEKDHLCSACERGKSKKVSHPPKLVPDNLGKMKPKADIGIFIGYSETSRGFRIYNRRTKKIMETINVKFDELTAMTSEHDSLELSFQRFINDDSS
ncbi:retrovirus-related pol polyprotein from transposon TNT 1-94 [Tanacetum coccineum]